MTADSHASAVQPAALPSRAFSPLRGWHWSVRRELWEYRSLYIAPLAAAGVVLFAYILGTVHLKVSSHVNFGGLSAADKHDLLSIPYIVAEAVIVATALLVGFFYCLGALQNERRERSILFWKSLPVSDLTTVLSKATIPLLVLPLTIFAIIVATHLIMFVFSGPIHALRGLNGAQGYDAPSLLRIWTVVGYILGVLPLWYAPVWAWLLLVSGWARRMAFVWAVAPPLALCIIEKIAFDTSYFAAFLGDRLAGGVSEATNATSKGRMLDLSQLDPAKFVASPGLWLGLVIAATLLAAAVSLRRYRDPM